MVYTYLKSSLRSLFKNKVFTIINILGLSIGTSTALVIYLIVQYNLSFDRFEPGRDRVYRVVDRGKYFSVTGAPAPLHTALSGLTGLEKTAVFFEYNGEEAKVSIPQGNNKTYQLFNKQDKIVFADQAYFDLFPHEWLVGNENTSLKAPHQVVLSESRAHNYFPGIPVMEMIGKTILFDDTIGAVVTGVVKDLKGNTDFDNEIFIALSTIPESSLKKGYDWTNWNNNRSQLMVRLLPGESIQQVERQLKAVSDKYEGKNENKDVFQLQPLSDIHFSKDFYAPASKSTLWDLSLIATFILLLGAINFVNLSTAQASTRAKEIGMRKILGSSRGRLVAMFMTETFLLTAVAAIISVLVAPFLLKMFSDFIPQGVIQQGVWQPHVFVFLVLLILLVGFLSGFYPALVLTSFNPLAVTKNQPVSPSGRTRSVWLRKTLTVSQFAVAQVFIIGTVVVGSQLHYAIHKDMGFRKDAILNFEVAFPHAEDQKFVLLNKLRSIPEIEAVSLGDQSPAFDGGISTRISFKDGKKDRISLVAKRSGDSTFINLYHIKLLAGRSVLSTDSATELLINETLSKQLGFRRPEDAIGHYLGFDVFGEKASRQLPIVGVMSDFHLASMRIAIKPMIFYSDLRRERFMHVALHPDAPDTWKIAIAKIQTAWKEIAPGTDFEYTFLDKTIEDFYDQDKKLSNLLSWATSIGIFISCLGLMGLVIYTSNQRAKEISIRKILGATVAQIISLLSVDFVRLVSLAFLIAVPIAWYLTHQWLDNFAYHTPLSWWIFVVSGASMLVLTLLILCVKAGRTAMANPVKNLRVE